MGNKTIFGHQWKSHQQYIPGEPDEWLCYCDVCGVEFNDETEHEECADGTSEHMFRPHIHIYAQCSFCGNRLIAPTVAMLIKNLSEKWLISEDGKKIFCEFCELNGEKR
jgi:hypothetical protein